MTPCARCEEARQWFARPILEEKTPTPPLRARLFSLGSILLGWVALNGCAHSAAVAKAREDALMAPAAQVARVPSLYTDVRALQKGDLVTVQISENSRGFKQNRSKAEKNTDLAADFEGNVGNLGAKGIIGNNLSNAALKTKNKYDGESGLEKKGTLVANVTAMIVEVLPNGNFRLYGEQEITLDRGKQTITVEGIVRPEDVSGANTVLSTRLANAKIKYKSAHDPDIHRYGIAAWVFSLIF